MLQLLLLLHLLVDLVDGLGTRVLSSLLPSVLSQFNDILHTEPHSGGGLLQLHQLHLLEVAAEVCEARDRALGHPLVGLLIQRLAQGGQQPTETLQGLLVTGVAQEQLHGQHGQLAQLTDESEWKLIIINCSQEDIFSNLVLNVMIPCYHGRQTSATLKFIVVTSPNKLLVTG